MTKLNGFRLVQVQRGDTLQKIAARTLGDFTRWAELVWINKLAYPYITDDPNEASATVLLSGALLKVPASTIQASTTADPTKLFGIDLALVDGELDVDGGGDLATVAGVDNLQQALQHRIETDQGELIAHLDYGCRVRRLMGKGNGPTTGQLAAAYVSASLRADPRVQAVPQVSSEVRPDGIVSTATVTPIVGLPVTVSSGS